MEAMGAAAAAAIAQASVAGGQGGPSNLQRFKTHHPPTFAGGGDPMVVDHWFRQIEMILEAMNITSDATKIRLTAFQLEGESQVWWDWFKTSRDIKAMTWVEFHELFMSKYFFFHRQACEDPGVPRAKAGDDDSDGVRGYIHIISPFC